VAHGYLVVAFLGIDDFAMIENIKSEKSLLFKILSIPPQTNDEAGRGVVRSNENLLFKDNSVLPRHVLVGVFKRFDLLYLFESQVRTISYNLNLKLVTFSSCIIGRHSFNDDGITLATVRLKDQVLQLHNIEHSLALSLRHILLASLALVHKSKSHVPEKIFVIRYVDLQVEDSISFGNLEIILSKDVIFAFFKGWDFGLIVLDTSLLLARAMTA